MNLTFRVLWYDDRRDFFDSLDLDPFKEHVRGWGFEPQIELVTTAGDFMKMSPFAPYDLIVVDYKLEKDELHGEDFIKRVRDNKVYTEIIFYSANASSDLWAAIHKNQLEGVFVSDKDLIGTKLESVARQSVHKVLDLNNMRGMVMAEVGDIDQVMDAILKSGLPELEKGKRDKIFSDMHKQVSKQTQKTAEKLQQLQGNSTVDSLFDLLSDSYKRWIVFSSMMKSHDAVKGIQIGNYNEDVLIPRNHLAHGTPHAVVGGYIFKHQDREYRFDRDISQSLRKTILVYKQQFRDIHSKLAKKGA